MITFRNYQLEEEDGRFNLFKIVTSKNGKERKEIQGWAMTFPRVLERISSEIGENETLEISEYLNRFSELNQELKSFFNKQ